MREIEKKHDIHEKSLSFYFNQEDKLFTFFKHPLLPTPLPFSRPSPAPSRPRGAAPGCARLAVSPLDLVLLIRF